MLSSSTAADNLSIRDSNIDAIIDLEQQISLLDAEILPLREKTAKKLAKIEKKLKETNNLIDSSLGSKADKAELRKTKRELRDRRVQLWAKLEVLPRLEEQREELQSQIVALRRRHGVL